MNKKRKRKRTIFLATTATISVLSATGVIVSCANINTTGGVKYIGPRSTIRLYAPSPNGDPYANQPWWFTNVDTNYGLVMNVMGTTMNDSERNPLIRPVNIGVPNEVARPQPDKSKPPKMVNTGDITKTYFRFVTASSVTISYKTSPSSTDILTTTYNSDATPAPIKASDAKKLPKHELSWQSINSTPDNVKPATDGTKTFSYIMKKMIVTKMAIGIRNNAYWSTNMGTATKYPITSDDYWYGLQLAHLQNSSYRLKGTNGHNGGINDVWDSNINQNLGGQVPIGATAEQNDNWNTTYKQYDINTDAFKESQEKEFTRDKKVVNIPLKNSTINDGWNAFKGSFINQQFFPAVSKVQTLRNIKNYSQYADGTSLASKYGYYANVFAAAKTFKNILWASPFTCEGLFDVQAIYHRARGLNLPTKNLGRGRESIQNIIWTFSKQTDTFPESQFQKYLQGSTAILNKYSSLSDASKDLINVNKKTMGVHYAKNIVSQVVKGDTTWGALVPGTSKSDNAKQAYYNNGYTEAMFGETLKQTYSAQKSGDANYFKHYYTYGTALRSSLSAAINWYTSILNFTKNSKSNWGSAFAKDMVIQGTDGSTTASGPKPHSGPENLILLLVILCLLNIHIVIMALIFSKPLQITPTENSQSFINNVSNQLKSFQSAKYQQIKAQVKQTLNAIHKSWTRCFFHRRQENYLVNFLLETYKKTAAERNH